MFAKVCHSGTKKSKKNKKTKPMGWKKSAGLGFVIFFFGFLEVFPTFDGKLETPRENQKNQNDTPQPPRSSPSHGFVFFCFFWFSRGFCYFSGKPKKHNANMLFNILIITSAFEFFDNHSLNPSGKSHLTYQFL